MTNPDWTTPDTDGWHWLRTLWGEEPTSYVAYYRNGLWFIHMPVAPPIEYTAEDIAKVFTYTGPIPEPKEDTHD